MQNAPNINLNDLVQQIHILCPHTKSDNEGSDMKLREKLEEQLLQKCPQVELEHLDLKYIIMNVKRSLSEFQKKIDESVVQQQLRRTTRIRKAIHQDPVVINFFNRNKFDRKVFSSATIKSDATPTCSNSKCCHEISDLNDIVQVESLPLSASTNLLTIFVPSILQEKLHSCKYKISIDLNRLDLTKQILDLNVEQQVNSSQETKKTECPPSDEEISEKIDLSETNELKITCDIKDDIETEEKAETTEVRSVSSVLEIATTPKSNEVEGNKDATTALEPSVTVSADTEVPPITEGKKRGRKRLKPKKSINDPPKKRGRKPGSKNKKKNEKSELAKYVEMFECNASSPAVSQIVTSTTQNWDMPEQNGQIAYFMNGQWTLNAPSNHNHQLVSTTNNLVNLDEANSGQETYIPFEDFVNFIENPSLDAGNNVIARVLDGTGDTAPPNINSQSTESIRFSVDIPLTSKSNLTTEVNQPILSTTNFDDATGSLFNRENDVNPVHSTATDNELNINDEILDLSKDHNSSAGSQVLDLTRDKKAEQVLSSPAFNEGFQQTDNKEGKTVIFSTNRSMPSLDDMDTDLFCSPIRSDNEKSVIFSIRTSTTPSFSSNCLRSPNDSIADSAIEVERKGSSTAETIESSKCSSANLSDKAKPELLKGMSLLEIERNIDDSLLDFDNCMDDDLLSLAPSSCFNSPTEDRFAESRVLETDETNVRDSIYADTINHSATSHTSTNSLASDDSLKKNEEPSKRKEEETVKNFRIPKKTTRESLQEEPRFAAGVSKANIPEKTPGVSNESLHPGGCDKLLISSGELNTAFVRPPTMKSPEAFTSRDVSKIFGPLCYNFLVDKCSDISCKFSHQPTEPTSVMNSLVFLQEHALHSTYRFIWRHYKLFKMYFPIFCEEYARRNLRRKLSNMITDCEMQYNCQQFLRNIYSALITCGLNRVNACRFILNRAKGSSSAELDVLMEMIVESGATMFSATIEQFALVPNYRFKMKVINDLATTCLHSGSAELITVLIKCLINVDQVEFITFRSTELIQILEMIKNGGVGGL